MERKKLNVGCGADIKKGWVNLDSTALPGVDVVHDIEKLPLPFADESFDEVLCQDVLEHIRYVPVLRDIHRILKSRGALTIRTPHFTSKNNFIDPTHQKIFSVNTWDFFAAHTPTYNKRIARERAYYFDFAFTRITARRITFEHGSRLFFYNRLIEPLVHLSPRMQEIYESTFLCYAFPAQDIIVVIIK